MKVGIRKPSLKKSIKARTTGKIKRKIKKSVNPFYGKKGMGFIKNPKRAVYNKVYRKTTVSAKQAVKGGGKVLSWICRLFSLLLLWPLKVLISLFRTGKKSPSAERSENPARRGRNTIAATSASPVPPEQGDYARAVFLWANRKPHALKKKEEYADYFAHECGITDPAAYHSRMIAEGYMGVCSLGQALSRLKPAELREILETVGLPTDGRKVELIARAEENVPPSVLRRYCPPLYAATEAGEAFIAAHSAYIRLHQKSSWGISLAEYEASGGNQGNFAETVWQILKKRAAADTKTFGRNEYLSMHQLMCEEGEKSLAMTLLLRVLYIDFSGVCGLSMFALVREGLYTKKELAAAFDSAVTIAPALIERLPQFADAFSVETVDRLYEWKLPINICSKETFLKIIHTVIESGADTQFAEALLQSEYSAFVKSL